MYKCATDILRILNNLETHSGLERKLNHKNLKLCYLVKTQSRCIAFQVTIVYKHSENFLFGLQHFKCKGILPANKIQKRLQKRGLNGENKNAYV